MVSGPINTLQGIKNTVRRLVSSPDPSQLSEADLEAAINSFYVQEVPASVKTDQLRTVLEIFTSPNVEKYDVDVNTYQELQDPVFINGRPGNLYKDRSTFYGKWSRQSQVQTPATGDGTVGPYNFTLSNMPILPGSVVIGTVDTGGGIVKVEDNGSGGLVEANTSTSVGSIVYSTGVVSFTPTQAILSGQGINVWSTYYTAGYPSDILYWNNQVSVRPVPDDVYRIEVNAILTPTAFAANDSRPVVDQWWQFVSYGTAIRIMTTRQDMAGVENIKPLFLEQRSLVIDRQASEEIGQRNVTIYSGGDSHREYNGYYT